MKLRYKLISGYFAIFLTIAILMGIFFSKVGEAIILHQIHEHLITTSVTRADHIETYLNQNIERLKLITSRTALRNNINQYNLEPSEELHKAIQTIIKDAKEPLPEIERICIINPEGNVIASTQETLIGRDVSSETFFKPGLIYEGAYFTKEDNSYKLIIAGPIFLEGNLIGEATTIVSLAELTSIITNRAGLQKSGEVLIAFRDKENNLIFPISRLFENDALAEFASDTALAMKKAILGEERVFINTLDYRNQKVIASTSFIETGNIGLVAKIDSAEAYQPLKKLLIYYLLMILGTIIIYLFFSVLLSQIITQPIENLQLGVNEVIKGNLNHRVSINSNDEIGVLARSFDTMTKAIKLSRAQVDKRVKEQTQEIRNQKEELEKQSQAIHNVLEDIEEEKNRVEIERNKFNAILNNIGDGLVVVDTTGKIMQINHNFTQLTGFTSKDALGKKFVGLVKSVTEGNKIIPEKERIMTKTLVMKKEHASEHSGAHSYLKKDGSAFPVLASCNPVFQENKLMGAVEIFRDFTREKDIDKAKTEFVSLASHQLRTPLSTINWYSEMLLSGDAGALNKLQKQYLQEAYNGSKKMVSLVNALLNVSRIELGTFAINPQPVKLSENIQEVLVEMQPQIKAKKIKIKLKLDKTPTLNADPDLMNIVFQNLINNAIKYTAAGHSINIKLQNCSPGDKIAHVTCQEQGVLFMVKDEGMGIPGNQQDKIFQKLFRADNARQSDTEGTGLGLYIVKSIVKQSRGEVWFESQENKGTTFFVLMPLSGMPKKEGTKKLEP